ncbi:chromate efflux transporter [Actinoplanes derwentensis]|uniref:Chromate transporter n=1 Tax=Actinoplanes derwentensis TaxID=113562 RepID=A0A1H2BP93_9ACTN|nr:chromate efflux transporter [Actinoplanes derwentensis]GID86933.1 chromate transporter [Actinoplanes derwentensis]SDT60190.1 chromate transporter [Actinoplanes derwentensis]
MTETGRVREVAWVFLRLGTIAFGGPVAHIAMMRDEVVRRRGWITDERFADLMGATNLIPGPNSTELAVHLGHDRARWRGLLTAGICFILPAALIVTGLAAAYVRFGETPAAEGLLYGIVPAVVAIIVHALTGLLRAVLKTVWLGALAATALAAYLAGVDELLILAAGAALPAVVRLARRAPRGSFPVLALPMTDGAGDLGQLFLTMLKIGSVLYGSGYVLLAFLRGDFVDRLHWITEQQLLDAISIGQVTPGPVFTTATFIGYVVAGLPGAFLATVAIFLPSFLFVGLLTRLTGRLRASPWTSVMLDGVNATSLALMAGVGVQLARTAVVDPLTAAITVGTLVAMWRTRWNSAWFIGAGALIGLGHTALGGYW